MSGRKQHHIPKLHLRGFLTPSTGKAEQVWVFRRRQEPTVNSIKDVAAERDFYSKPSLDGSQTLDDRFTDYENARLAALVRDLRLTSVNATVSPSAAAEIVAHLAPRSSHLRATFHQMLEGLFDVAKTIFSDADNVFRLLGFDQMVPSDRFRSLSTEILSKATAPARAVPNSVLEQLLFWFARENFRKFFTDHTPVVHTVLDSMPTVAKDTARDGHVRALAKDIVPSERHDDLSTYSWMIEAAPPEGAILPDCVAIVIVGDGEPKPYMMASNDEIEMVIMPISSTKILVGRRTGAQTYNLPSLNGHLAACSAEFFVAASNIPEILEVFGQLGDRSTAEVEDALAGAANVYLPRPILDKFSTGNEASEARPQEVVTSPGQYEVSLLGFGDHETAQKLAEQTNLVVSAVSLNLPLSRLDGITFAEDYPTALRNLDRGFTTTGPLETVGEEIGIGVAWSPIVIRDGVVKSRIICRSGLATGLLAEDDPEATKWAVHLLVRQLAGVAVTGIMDDAFPGILMKPIEDPYEGMIYRGLNAACESYFTASWAAGYGDADVIGGVYREALIGALSRADEVVNAARSAYRTDGDLDKLIAVAFTCVGHVLTCAATLHGHHADSQKSPFDDEGRLEALLIRLDLRSWFDIFGIDLKTLWLRRNRWESIQEFIDFNRHVERLLWQFGLYPWRNPDGRVRFAVPEVVGLAGLLRIHS